VVHRDLKPGNIMRRTTDHALVLVDFGTVREVIEDPRLGGSTVAGTYGYMAPEQFRGEAEPRTDLYAVGVLGVVLLSRRDPLDLVGAHHRLDWRGAVYASDGVKALLERLLAPDLVMRPASATSARASIAALRRGEATPAPAPPTLPVPQDAPPAPAPVITRALRRRVGARSRPLAVALAVLGGYWGLHNWYLPGRKARAVLSLVFFWTFIPLLLSLLDAWSMVRGSQADFDARFNPELMIAAGRAPDPAAAIERLHALHLQGALSKKEFEREKRRVLADHAPGPEGLVDPEAVGQLLGQLGLGSDRLLRKLAKKTKGRGIAGRIAREVLGELEGSRRRKPPDDRG
jgi:serine/threonine protein kinase